MKKKVVCDFCTHFFFFFDILNDRICTYNNFIYEIHIICLLFISKLFHTNIKNENWINRIEAKSVCFVKCFDLKIPRMLGSNHPYQPITDFEIFYASFLLAFYKLMVNGLIAWTLHIFILFSKNRSGSWCQLDIKNFNTVLIKTFRDYMLYRLKLYYKSDLNFK